MEYLVYRCTDCGGEYIILTADIKRLGVHCENISCPYCKTKHKHRVGEFDDFKECLKNKK